MEIDSLILPDGRILDLAPSPSPDELAFLVWNNPHAVDAGYGGHPCSLCTEFGLDKLSDGTKLKHVDLPRPTRRREPIFGPDMEIM